MYLSKVFNTGAEYVYCRSFSEQFSVAGVPVFRALEFGVPGFRIAFFGVPVLVLDYPLRFLRVPFGHLLALSQHSNIG